MFFSLSKILWFFADPGNMIMIAITLSCVLLWLNWLPSAKVILTIVVLSSLSITFFPIGKIVINNLENRFPIVTSLPKDVSGIIVLGGLVDQFVTNDRDQISFNGAVERIIVFSKLSNLYPHSKLIFTGGSGVLGRQDLKEAIFVEEYLKSQGMETERILFEDQSKNTAENALFAKRLLRSEHRKRWILITSAFHMPRAVGSFRKQGWNVLAYPVDFRTRTNIDISAGINFREKLNTFALGLHECLGLLFYFLTNKTIEIYPAP